MIRAYHGAPRHGDARTLRDATARGGGPSATSKPAPGSSAASGAAPGGVRLGSVERRILQEVARRGGAAARVAIVNSVFPTTVRRLAKESGPGGDARRQHHRADAESAISRAMASLARKGLLLIERRRTSGFALVRDSGCVSPPPWEIALRGEESLLEACDALTLEARRLALRARRRMALLGVTGLRPGLDIQRRDDLDTLSQVAVDIAGRCRRAARSGMGPPRYPSGENRVRPRSSERSAGVAERLAVGHKRH